MTEPRVLDGVAAAAYAVAIRRALDALRLNRQFPPWERVAAHVAAAAEGGLRVDRASALPSPREWVRARVEAELAGRAASELVTVREVHVALRHVAGERASYAVRVDRLDVVTATLARYSIVLSDRPGRSVSQGELALEAADRLQERLELLATQDAALALVALRAEGLEVEEVVRGVVGPGVYEGCGPPALVALDLRGFVLSACLERAGTAVEGVRVDDPLATSAVLPAEGASFGLTRLRKWAAEARDVPALRRWLDERGSRGIVAGW